MYMYIKNYQ